MPHTNLDIYKEIIIESFEKMVLLDKEAIRPKPDGSEGNVIRYDPDHESFKHALKVIVFSGMWLEAFFHQIMVSLHSKNKFQKNNKKSYKEKLELIGINDQEILDKAEVFQKTRNEIIHEKAFMDNGVPKLAQVEAKRAHLIIEHIEKAFEKQG